MIRRAGIGGLIGLTMLALTGCLDEGELNTDSVQYQPEPRELNVIAGNGGEFAPGSTVTLGGRLVGTVTNESAIWKQISGTSVDVDDWTATPLTFTAPDIEGIESLKFQITGLDASGNPLQRNVRNDSGEVTGTELMQEEVSITIVNPEAWVFFEVEDSSVATLDGVALEVDGGDHFIGGASGQHTRDFVPGNLVTFTIDPSTNEDLEPGYYSLYASFAIGAGYGDKHAGVTANDQVFDVALQETGGWKTYRIGGFDLVDGVNTITVGGGWNYYRLDNIALIPTPPPPIPKSVSASLVNPNASDSAQYLMALLTRNYAKQTLTGQTEFMNYSAGETGLREYQKVVDATGGAAPAIVSFDFMDFSATRVACGQNPGTLSEDMIAEYQSKGVILSALWHWNAPMNLVDSTCSSDVSHEAWWHGFYTEASTFDLSLALADPDGDEYAALLADIDTISAELQKFEDAGVPVLWRPLHEAEGGWFWWGDAGADAFKELWVLMYNRMTTTHGLDNLIWVFTHAGDLDEDWYPGDTYVDIVGYDGYASPVNDRSATFTSQFETLMNRFDGKKLIALTETGTIPDVEAMHAANAWWAYFATWNSTGDIGPDGTTAENIKATYDQEAVINQSALPQPVAAGTYADFENEGDGDGWNFQLAWADIEGRQLSTDWAASGNSSLAGAVDLTDQQGNVVLQVYPPRHLLVGEFSQLKLHVNAANVAAGLQAKLWAKNRTGDWFDAGTVAVAEGGVELTLDISNKGELQGFGVEFVEPHGSGGVSTFYVDNVVFE